jgi:hypothetical protein
MRMNYEVPSYTLFFFYNYLIFSEHFVALELETKFLTPPKTHSLRFLVRCNLYPIIS